MQTKKTTKKIPEAIDNKYIESEIVDRYRQHPPISIDMCRKENTLTSCQQSSLFAQKISTETNDNSLLHSGISSPAMVAKGTHGVALIQAQPESVATKKSTGEELPPPSA
jgi:hypothetical protein